MNMLGAPKYTVNKHDTLEDRMIKIVNISGSMREKLSISSKFCMVSKGKTLGIFGYLEAP
jgi:hypothetical protein